MTWVPWSVGAATSARHHGWSPSILVQVSNILMLNTNGKVQLSQPVSVGYVGGSLDAVQTASNPVRVTLPSDLNLTVSVLVLLMMLHGWEIDPQCFEKLSSSTKSYPQFASS